MEESGQRASETREIEMFRCKRGKKQKYARFLKRNNEERVSGKKPCGSN